MVAAMFFGLFGDEFEITKNELTAGSSNTIVLDLQGNEIASLNVKEKRKVKNDIKTKIKSKNSVVVKLLRIISIARNSSVGIL